MMFLLLDCVPDGGKLPGDSAVDSASDSESNGESDSGVDTTDTGPVDRDADGYTTDD